MPVSGAASSAKQPFVEQGHHQVKDFLKRTKAGCKFIAIMINEQGRIETIFNHRSFITIVSLLLQQE